MSTIKFEKLSSETWALIKGPAKVEIKDGIVEVFGATLKTNDSFTVIGGRQAPMKCITNTELMITLGENGSYEIVKEKLIPDDWDNAVNEIIKHPSPVVMIIGAVDTGKSGFALFLTNKLIANGMCVAVIDTDVGQSDIGPPGTISMTILTKQIPSFLDAKLIDAYFIGDKTPVGHLLPVVVGSHKMVKKAQALGANAIVINTSGLTRGGVAMALKYHMIETINPNILVALQQNNESEHLLRPHTDIIKIIRLKTPSHILKRNREERGDFRSFKLTKYLLNAKSITLDLDKTTLLNTTIKQLPEDTFLKEIIKNTLHLDPAYAGSDGTSAVIVIDELLPQNQLEYINNILRSIGFEDVKIIVPQLLKGLLLGLYDATKNFLGLGTLERLDLHKNTLTIKSHVSENDVVKIKYVYLGYLILNETGIELKRLKPGTF
jgi:polynucleotide 5'-hydroxyl-kinase GRC3/NOL9